MNSRKYFGRSIDADWFGVLPITTPSELDSKHSLRVIDFVPIAGFGLRMLNNSAAVSDALKNQANAVYDTVTQAEIRNSYASDEKLTLWERTENYLRLAKFDQVYRAGYVHDDFEKNNQDNTEDVLKIFQNVNFDRFTPHICCLLNPSLKAVGSFGGADADLVFDDVLIDLKTSTEFKLTSRDLNQLIGYLVLSRLGGFSGAKNTPQIRRLGIYFARYAYLYTFSVDELITEDNLNTFCKWFKKR